MATVYIDYRTISWGAPNEDDNSNVWQVEDGNADPGEITIANFGHVGTPISGFPAPPTYMLNGKNYTFAFWNVTDGSNALASFPSTANNLSVPDMPPGVLMATAWYALPGGVNGGGPALVTRTFDIDINNFRKETPVQSALPGGAWLGPNYHETSTKAGDAVVTPKSSLLYPAPSPNQTGALPKYFQSWQKIVGTPNISSNNFTIEEDKEQSALAVAFYGHRHQSIVGHPATGSIYSFWEEFWGKRGAEGEGEWGPRGPSQPWGPLVERAIASFSPVEQGIARGVLASIAQRVMQER